MSLVPYVRQGRLSRTLAGEPYEGGHGPGATPGAPPGAGAGCGALLPARIPAASSVPGQQGRAGSGVRGLARPPPGPGSADPIRAEPPPAAAPRRPVLTFSCARR